MSKSTGASRGRAAKRFSFAHLMGLSPKAEDEVPEEEDKIDPEEEDDQDTEPEAEGEDDDEPEADGEDGGDEEDEKEGKAAAQSRALSRALKNAERRGAKAERDRCAAIFASEEAAGNVALAAQLAFGTGLSAREAIATLKAGGSAPRGRLSQLMNERPSPKLGDGGGAPDVNDKEVNELVGAYQLATGKQAKARRR